MSKFVILVAIGAGFCTMSCLTDAIAAFPQSPTIGDAGEAAQFAQRKDGAELKEANPAEAVAEDAVPEVPTPQELEQAKTQTAAEEDAAKRSPAKPPSESLDSPALKIQSAPVDSPAPGSASSTDSLNQVNAKFMTPETPVAHVTTAEQTSPSAQAIANAPITTTRKSYLGIVCRSQSATVLRVRERTAASLAGFEVGDVLLQINGQPVNDFDQFLAVLHQNQPGDSLDVEVQRGEQTEKLFVILGAKLAP